MHFQYLKSNLGKSKTRHTTLFSMRKHMGNAARWYQNPKKVFLDHPSVQLSSFVYEIVKFYYLNVFSEIISQKIPSKILPVGSSFYWEISPILLGVEILVRKIFPLSPVADFWVPLGTSSDRKPPLTDQSPSETSIPTRGAI